MSGPLHAWIATAPLGAASVLAEELAIFGASAVRERSHDVRFEGTLEVGYRACLWSRAATRVYRPIGVFPAQSAAGLLEALRRVDWREHFAPGATLACSASGGNAAIRHTVYASQLLKDAVCDGLRAATGVRPDVRPQRPDVPLHLHVEGTEAQVSIDFAGESLHRRGYRLDGGRAPLKENLAAAILLRALWPAICAEGGALVDPMCGSGTLLIEAAAIAADAAPGLERDYYGFLGWRGHEPELWRRLLAEARARREARAPRRCIHGFDADGDAVRAAIGNVAAAGFADWVHVERRALSAQGAAPSDHGLLICNPPYGERIGAAAQLPALYAELGRVMRENFAGWQAAILAGNPPLARHLGIHAKRSHPVTNGAIECRLLRFDLGAARLPEPRETLQERWAARSGAQMFANRLRKNLRRLEPWAVAEGIECYRLYDADMPEYAFAIDLYGRTERHVYLQEYAAPRTVGIEQARERRREVLAALPQVLEVPIERVHARTRRPQKGAAQYDKRASSEQRHEVHEGGLKFWVNFRDYLDTGLFLDHRTTRALLRDWAADADFLNLFCYTGSATVYAAAGGARSTTSVDLSNTYLAWTRDNLELNALMGPRHRLVRADCLEWLRSAAAAGPAYDLIFLDPPTFSNSKRMEGVLDVQRDHPRLIRDAMAMLRRGGRLVFSTNYTRFRLDEASLAACTVEDLSARTIPRDFERNSKIHHCYLLRHA